MKRTAGNIDATPSKNIYPPIILGLQPIAVEGNGGGVKNDQLSVMVTPGSLK